MFLLPKSDWNKIEITIIPPPKRTLDGGISFIKSQAHKGPKTDSVNIKTPTTAAGVVWEPTVIKINPKPIWKNPAIKAKNKSWKEIASFPAKTKPIIAAKIPAVNCAGTMSTFGYFLTIITNIAKDMGIINATKFPENCSLDWIDKELPNIIKTPDMPKMIEARVIKSIFSFKKKYPSTAKNIVSVVIIKFVLATVVVYMANTYAANPKDKNKPPINPGRPEI